jgi:hypothetical protein
MIKELVVNGKHNTIDLLLKADGVAEDLTTVTKVEFVDEAGVQTTISSEDDPDYFTWDPLKTGQTGKLICELGEAGIPVGTYVFRVMIYDPVNTLGIFWDRILIEVI